MTFRYCANAVVALGLFASPLPAEASDTSHASRLAGACANRDVLSTIVHRFGQSAPGTLKADLDIVEIRDMHLRHFQPKDRTNLVGRDYCGASALTSDGTIRPIWYLIERDLAFAGLGSKVEFCLGGLDPDHVYGAHCASLK